MNPTLDAFLRSWPSTPGCWPPACFSAAFYLRGWWFLHRRDPGRWSGIVWPIPGWHVDALAGAGLADQPFASLLLQVHMVQHLLLMMRRPRSLLGAPLFPLLRRAARSDPRLLGRAFFCAPWLRRLWID